MEGEDWMDLEHEECYASNSENDEGGVNQEPTPEPAKPIDAFLTPQEVEWKRYAQRLEYGKLAPIEVCQRREGIERHLQHIKIRTVKADGALAYHFYHFFRFYHCYQFFFCFFFPRHEVQLRHRKKQCCTIDGCSSRIGPNTGSTIMEQQVARDHPDIWMALSTFRNVQEKEKAEVSQPSIAASLRRPGTTGLNDRQKQFVFLRTLSRWIAEDLVPLSYLQKPRIEGHSQSTRLTVRDSNNQDG